MSIHNKRQEKLPARALTCSRVRRIPLLLLLGLLLLLKDIC